MGISNLPLLVFGSIVLLNADRAPEDEKLVTLECRLIIVIVGS